MEGREEDEEGKAEGDNRLPLPLDLELMPSPISPSFSPKMENAKTSRHWGNHHWRILFHEEEPHVSGILNREDRALIFRLIYNKNNNITAAALAARREEGDYNIPFAMGVRVLEAVGVVDSRESRHAVFDLLQLALQHLFFFFFLMIRRKVVTRSEAGGTLFACTSFTFWMASTQASISWRDERNERREVPFSLTFQANGKWIKTERCW